MDAENLTELETLMTSEAERPPHRLGLKRSNPRGSRRGQFSQALRKSGQHHAQELPAYIREWIARETKDKRNVTVICHPGHMRIFFYG